MVILILRNIAYWLIVTLSVPVSGTLAPLLLPFPRRLCRPRRHSLKRRIL